MTRESSSPGDFVDKARDSKNAKSKIDGQLLEFQRDSFRRSSLRYPINSSR